MSHRTTAPLVFAAAVILAAPLPAAEPPPPAGGNWPQWGGPDRTNVSAETGLLKEWPPGGPPLLWKADGLGGGVSPVAVAGGKVFVLGDGDGREFLTALAEADGTRLWSAPVGPAVTGVMPVMRWLSQRTPTVDGDRVYAVTGRGELVCAATADGRERWRKDYVRDFDGVRGPWGYCDFPLVDGDRLICTPGGGTATVVALDKAAGAVVWKCALPAAPRSTYGAIVAADIGGTRQYIHQFDATVVGIAAADGRLLWESQPADRGGLGGNVYTALVRGDEVFASWGWTPGAALLKVTRDGAQFRAQVIYRTKLPFDPWVGSSVRLGDYVHAANGLCVEWKTGRLVHQTAPPAPPAPGQARAPAVPRVVRMTMTAADGRLYHRTGNNLVTLSEVAADGGYVKRGEFTAPRVGGEPTWTFPVVTGGRLYLRDQGALLCYDVREKAVRRRRPDVIFVPTPQDVVERMLELARVTRDDVVADLGCGDGRIVVTAAKKYGCQAVGWDLDRECVRLSLANVKKEGVENLVRVEHGDVLAVDLSGISVVTLYLGPVMNAKLLPQLERLKPGARIVSHAFDMPGVTPDRVVSVTSAEDDVARKLYLWTTPLKRERKEGPPARRRVATARL
jgi:SAM-dependent methyltransferase